jgi:uncharacterized protein YegL
MTMSDQYTPNAEEAADLFREMSKNNLISDESKELVVHNMNEIMAMAVVGTVAMKLETEDPFKVLLVIDRSGSMGSKWIALVDGLARLINRFIKLQSTFGVEILLAIVFFDDVIEPTVPFTKVDQIDPSVLNTHKPRGSTAQWDGWFVSIAGSVGNDYLLHKDGIRGSKTFAILLGDGGENASTQIKDPGDIAKFMADIRRPKKRVFAAFGFGDKRSFTAQFTKMGFLPHNIRVLADGDTAIDEALEMISQTIAHHSQAHSLGLNPPMQGNSADTFFIS